MHNVSGIRVREIDIVFHQFGAPEPDAEQYTIPTIHDVNAGRIPSIRHQESGIESFLENRSSDVDPNPPGDKIYRDIFDLLGEIVHDVFADPLRHGSKAPRQNGLEDAAPAFAAVEGDAEILKSGFAHNGLLIYANIYRRINPQDNRYEKSIDNVWDSGIFA